MENLKAKLVATLNNGRQRVYQLSMPITKGYNRLQGYENNVVEALNYIRKRLRPEYVDIIKEATEVTHIVISDAKTHSERLVFPAMPYTDLDGTIRYHFSMDQIEGCHTMMIHGGDETSMKPDYVYIRLLANRNGYKFTLKDFDNGR